MGTCTMAHIAVAMCGSEFGVAYRARIFTAKEHHQHQRKEKMEIKMGHRSGISVVQKREKKCDTKAEMVDWLFQFNFPPSS